MQSRRAIILVVQGVSFGGVIVRLVSSKLTLQCQRIGTHLNPAHFNQDFVDAVHMEHSSASIVLGLAVLMNRFDSASY